MNLAKNLAKKRKTAETSREALLTAGRPFERVYGIRLDPDRLDDDERERFADLARRATTDERGVNLAPLGKRDRAALERLLGKAAGEESLIERRREEAKLIAETRELARRAMQPAQRLRLEEAGSVTFPAELFRHLREGVVWAEDIGALFAVVAMLENATTLAPRSRIETGTLVLDRTYGLFGPADPEQRGRWRDSLVNLDRVGWLAVEDKGTTIRVRPGPQLASALRRAS
jgi:hypothetical protein